MGKYIFVAPYQNNQIQFPEDMELTYTDAEGVLRGGYVLMTPTVQGQDVPATVMLHTTPANRDILDADPDWAYMSEIVEADNAT